MVSALRLARKYNFSTFALVCLLMCLSDAVGDNSFKMTINDGYGERGALELPKKGLDKTLHKNRHFQKALNENKNLHKALHDNEVEILIDGEEGENVVKTGKTKPDDSQLYAKVKEFEEWR